jgi:hypothetical protein
MNFEEIKNQAIADFKELEDWLMRPVSEYNVDSFIEHLSNDRAMENDNVKTQIPIWRRSFEISSPADRDVYFIDDRTFALIKIPAGSTTAQCLILKELDTLPKEKGL